MQILVTSYDFSRHFIYQRIISNLVGMNETLLKYGKKNVKLQHVTSIT